MGNEKEEPSVLTPYLPYTKRYSNRREDKLTESEKQCKSTSDSVSRKEMNEFDGGDEEDKPVHESLAIVAYAKDAMMVDGEGRKMRGRKRKRCGRPKVVGESPAEDDVCFICLDGGDLQICEQKGCLKAYHLSCLGHGIEYFETKGRARGRWRCGWHVCNKCEKKAHYMCLTCTFSLCNRCIKDAGIISIRGKKGLCQTCIETVIMIESHEQPQINFDDKSSWEYLFKDYWIDLRQRLSITMDEITQAKNSWKGADVLMVEKNATPDEPYDDQNGALSQLVSWDSDIRIQKIRNPIKQVQLSIQEEDLPNAAITVGTSVIVHDAQNGGGPQSVSCYADTSAQKKINPKKQVHFCAQEEDDESTDNKVEWASEELLKFVMHVQNDNKGHLSQFEVQALLLEYISKNKLRDPLCKSQINCDKRLQDLFGKPCVRHFEMLKLIKSHFLVQDSQIVDCQMVVVDPEPNESSAV